MEERPCIFTVGHSNRSLADFIQLLLAHGVDKIADVRKMPRSRSNPQFNGETLPAALHEVGIGYVHIPGLAGLRRSSEESVNTGWRNKSFRAYADYMQTDAFAAALTDLIQQAQGHRIALLCAEAVPWRCHRSLIADALLARGIEVLDIIGPAAAKPHLLPAFARLNGESVTYPPEGQGDDSGGEGARPKAHIAHKMKRPHFGSAGAPA